MLIVILGECLNRFHLQLQALELHANGVTLISVKFLVPRLMQNISTKPENIFVACAHTYFRVFFFVNKLLLLLFLNFIVVFITRSIGGCNGGAKSPHLGPISFIFMQLSRNILPNDRLIPLPSGVGSVAVRRFKFTESLRKV